MIHNLKYFVLVSIIVPFLFVGTNAQEYTLQKQVIGTGGMHMSQNSNGEYYLSGIAGQLAIGKLEGTGGVDVPRFDNHQGFWTPEPKLDPNSVENDNTVDKELVNYPNPVTSQTTIKYDLKYSGYVSLKVYDLVGNVVASLINQYQNAGEHSFAWDIKDASGNRLSSGSYLYELNVSPSNTSGGSSLYDAYKMRNVMVIVD